MKYRKWENEKVSKAEQGLAGISRDEQGLVGNKKRIGCRTKKSLLFRANPFYSVLIRERGVTLVELLVAVALLSLLMVAFYTVFKGGTKAYETGEARVELIQNARVAFDMMVSQIRQALPVDTGANPKIDFWIEDDSGKETRDGTQIIFSAPIDDTDGAEEIRFTRFKGGTKTSTLYKRVDNPPYQTDEGSYSDPGESPEPVTAALPGAEGIVTYLRFEEKEPEAAVESGLIRITMAVSADPEDSSERVYSFHAIVKAPFCYGVGLTGEI